MSLTKESTLTQKLYNNYTVGIASIIVAILLPVILPILGDFISPLLFLAGILAILISKVSWPVKIISIVIPIALIVIFWNEYLSWILELS